MAVVAKLLFFSLLIIVFPLITFFSSAQGTLDFVLFPLFGSQVVEDSRLLFSGTLAVVAVNLVLALFLLSAWQEKPPPTNHKED